MTDTVFAWLPLFPSRPTMDRCERSSNIFFWKSFMWGMLDRKSSIGSSSLIASDGSSIQHCIMLSYLFIQYFISNLKNWTRLSKSLDLVPAHYAGPTVQLLALEPTLKQETHFPKSPREAEAEAVHWNKQPLHDKHWGYNIHSANT